MTILEDLTRLDAELDDLLQQYQGGCQERLKYLTDLMVEYPQITAIAWNQGTGSFCDGTPCTFNVNEDSVALSFTSEYVEELIVAGQKPHEDNDYDEVSLVDNWFYLHELADFYNTGIPKTIIHNEGKPHEYRYETHEYAYRYALPELEVFHDVLTSVLFKHSDYLNDRFGNASIRFSADGTVETSEYYLD